MWSSSAGPDAAEAGAVFVVSLKRLRLSDTAYEQARKVAKDSCPLRKRSFGRQAGRNHLAALPENSKVSAGTCNSSRVANPSDDAPEIPAARTAIPASVLRDTKIAAMTLAQLRPFAIADRRTAGTTSETDKLTTRNMTLRTSSMASETHPSA
jgi:hypothetical protein